MNGCAIVILACIAFWIIVTFVAFGWFALVLWGVILTVVAFVIGLAELYVRGFIR